MFNHSFWYYIGVFAFATFVIRLYIIYVKRRKNISQELDTDKYEMPANMWFYNKLISMEVGELVASYSNFHEAFMQYLHRRYFLSEENLKKSTIFELVNKAESNNDIIELYGDIYNTLEDFNETNSEEIIMYIKSIKGLFNKDDISEWVKQKKKSKDCNDC